MAKTAKTAATKSRETKLSKKSNEELIAIILRKDKTEKNLSSQVVNLKAENNNLSAKVSNFDADLAGTIKSYEDKMLTQAKNFDEYKQEAVNHEVQCHLEIDQANAKAAIWKVTAFAAIVIAILVATVSIFV